jgi:hypothetical protein
LIGRKQFSTTRYLLSSLTLTTHLRNRYYYRRVKSKIGGLSFPTRNVRRKLVCSAQEKRHARSVKNMKKTFEMNDELRPEYDFSKLTVVARGAGGREPAETTVTLAFDVAKLFPIREAVHEALPLLAIVARESEMRLGK